LNGVTTAPKLAGMQHGRAWRSRVIPLLLAGLVLPACSAAPPARPTPTTPAAPRPMPRGSRPSLPTVVRHGRRDSGMVALTFDSNMTDAMLAELARHQVASFDNRRVVDELVAERVPATFFLAGKWIQRYPDETRRIVADPLFEVGSHSYAHRAFHLPCYGLGGLPVAAMAADVARSEALLRRFTPHPTSYFRFPGGCYDRVALRAIAPAHVQVIQYDVASGDAFGTSVDAIVGHTLARTRGGSIVVMHVTGGDTAPLTARALPAIVAGLRGRGLRLVRLSTLLAYLPSEPRIR
jgi:peptidoglycan/xylan/chitin deacetylase (PgdA/CDA1 family)